ncbi:acyl-CoA reductase, partial [Gemmatimonadota bacterium]
MLRDAWHVPRGLGHPEVETEIFQDDLLPPLRIPKITPPWLRDLARYLRQVREGVLLKLSVDRIVSSVGGVAEKLLAPGDPLRQTALRELGLHARLSDPMARTILDGMARDWLPGRLRCLLRSEFRDPGVLDGIRPSSAGGRQRALGHPLIFHLGAGTVPGVAVTSLIRGLLVKSSILLRPGRGDVVLPLVFSKGLVQEDPELAEAFAVLYWPQEASLESVALEEADLVVVHGGDDTVGRVRSQLSISTPLLAYRHRIGVGLIGRETGPEDIPSEVADAARAVSLFDQRGCVSPHAYLVSEGGRVSPSEWARLL